MISSKTFARTGSAAMVALSLAAASAASADVPRTQPDQALQELARDLEPYKDVAYAIGQGYVQRSPCESHPMLGTMGHHYVRADLLGLTAPVGGKVNGTGTHTDVNQPGILLYVPDENGVQQLVAIEMLVFADAWHAQSSHPPKYRGREYNYMVDDPDTARDEAHNFMPHYDLHIWLFAHNPSGLYAQWNPAITCGGTIEEHAH